MSRLPQDLYGVREAPGSKPATRTASSAFTRNKTLLAVLGVVAAVGLGLVARKKNAAAATSTADTSTPGTSTITAGTAYNPYDSSTADLYNAIQPQLQQLQQLATQMQTPASPATSEGYYQLQGTGNIYQALSNGSIRWVDLPSWISAGKPDYTVVGSGDGMWRRPLSGSDAPSAGITTTAAK